MFNKKNSFIDTTLNEKHLSTFRSNKKKLNENKIR